MKTFLIAAALLMPACLHAQTIDTQADTNAAVPSSKINTAVRADVAARHVAAPEAPAVVGDVHVRTARTGGGKTVMLQNGTLPDSSNTLVAQANTNPGR